MIQHETRELEYLRRIEEKLIALESRTPIDQTVQISATQPWIVDYHERRHIFFWFPSAQTFSAEDYGSGPVQGQVWINLGFEAGIRCTVSSTTLVTMRIRCTDEVIP